MKHYYHLGFMTASSQCNFPSPKEKTELQLYSSLVSQKNDAKFFDGREPVTAVPQGSTMRIMI